MASTLEEILEIPVSIPDYGQIDGKTPIVILGPNGSGKTKLAQKISRTQKTIAISAQRRTWVDETLPVREEQQLRSEIRHRQEQWYNSSWQPTDEINYTLSTLIQDHLRKLSQRNTEAIEQRTTLSPVTDTKLMQLQQLWAKLYPLRKLEIDEFFPKVKRMDSSPPGAQYEVRQMSDGERTVLYMAARVLTAEHSVIVVDEPELHLHSRLSVKLWDELEKLQPDCRFVYVTHDLNFALSRRNATVLIARANESAESVLVDELPPSIAVEVLGAATLPFYAERIIFYEGEQGRGFASEFFSVWFDSRETFAIPAGDRNSVFSAVSGLKKVGVIGAEIIGLVDRDYYPDSMLNNVTDGVSVLPLNEIESILCTQDVVACISQYLGKDTPIIWQGFLNLIRGEMTGERLSHLVANRVRARLGDLFDGAFSGAQIGSTVSTTSLNHFTKLSDLDIPAKTQALFIEEEKRVKDALNDGGEEMLKILPGKQLLSLLTLALRQRDKDEVTGLVIRALERKQLKLDDPLQTLGTKLEQALLPYLPTREFVTIKTRSPGIVV